MELRPRHCSAPYLTGFTHRLGGSCTHWDDQVCGFLTGSPQRAVLLTSWMDQVIGKFSPSSATPGTQAAMSQEVKAQQILLAKDNLHTPINPLIDCGQ